MLKETYQKAWDFYFRHYKIVIFIPIIIAAFSLFQLVYQFQATGDFINRDVTLKGGITVTILLAENTPSALEVESALKSTFSQNYISVRALKSSGKDIGLLVESDVKGISKEQLDSLLSVVAEKAGRQIGEGDYSIESLGESLGKGFYRQTLNAMILAFIFMAIVVFIYFKSYAPSITVILCVFFDIIGAMATTNLLGMQIGTAGIAAYLMLIGYAVDTNILLTTRVLKRKGDESVHDSIKGAFGTGVMMTLTAIAALVVGLIFAQSGIIRQIMAIIFIGLIFDMLNTWVTNSGILLWFIEKKEIKK
jgi:preprotein translocase subunit SecF